MVPIDVVVYYPVIVAVAAIASYKTGNPAEGQALVGK
jgi:hypothetical protein